MAIAMYIGDTPLAMPRGFSIEFELNNLVFSDNMEVGSFSIPITLPITGNEQVLKYSHLLHSTGDVEVFDDCRYYEHGNLQYRGKLLVLKSQQEKSFRASFIVNALGLEIRDKLLNELEYEKIHLGNDDTEVLAAIDEAKDGSKIYCFPPVKALAFYDNEASIAPENVSINDFSTAWDNSDWTRPVVPFYFLTKFTDLLIRTLGFTPSGSFFDDDRMQKIVISNMACLENEDEETGFYAELPNKVSIPIAGNPSIFTTAQIYINGTSETKPILSTTGFSIDINLRFSNLTWEKTVNLDLINWKELKGSTTWTRQSFEKDFYLYKYRATLKVYVSASGFADPSDVEIFSTVQSVFPVASLNTGSGNVNGAGTASFALPIYEPDPADVGKFIRVECFIEEEERIEEYRFISLIPGGNTQGVDAMWVTKAKLPLPTWQFTDEYLGFADMLLSYDLAGNLLAGSINWNALLPPIKLSEFFNALKDDYNVQLTLRPGSREIILDLCRDVMSMTPQDWEGQVAANPEMVFDQKPKGFTIEQKFATEESDPDLLNGYDFLGEYINEAAFPEKRHKNYIINSENNLVYLPIIDSGVLVNAPGWSGTYLWTAQQWHAPNAVIGDGSKNIEAKFLPLVLNTSEEVVFYGTGKSRSVLRSESSENFFRSLNYIVERDESFAYIGHTATPLNVERQCYLLNYAQNNVHSLWHNLYAAWLPMLMASRELEVAFVDGNIPMHLLSLREPKTFNNQLFLVKQIRRSVDENADGEVEATIIQMKLDN